MKYKVSDLNKLYRLMLKDDLECQRKGSSIYIFTASDTDAVCTLKIFTSILKADHIQYAVVPVFSIASLTNEINDLKDKQHVRSLVFINCAGTIDLTQMWFYNKRYKIESYLFDYHRPIHHMNIIDPLCKIAVVDDGCKSFQECPTANDQKMYKDLAEQLDEESENEITDSDDEDLNEAKEELKDLQDLNPENIDTTQKADDLADKLVGTKRPRDQTQVVVDFRKAKRINRQIFNNYYRGSFYGKCSASLMYQLCAQMNRENRDILWYWIVGMADLILTFKNHSFEYDEDISKCNNEVQRLNPLVYGQYQEIPDAEAEADKPPFKDLYSVATNKNSNKPVGSIMTEIELKFMLMRHWTLFDSLQNSNYVLRKFFLWKEPGQLELKKFLAKIGISLDQAKQRFAYMDYQFRNTLKARVLQQCEQFQMGDVIMNSYIRQVDEKTQISAMDMACSITSILDSPKLVDPEMEHLVNNGDLEGMCQDKFFNQAYADASKIVKVQNFWTAYDALELRNKFLLDFGIEIAKLTQSAIVRISSQIMERKEVKIGNEYRYAIIETDYLKEVKFFQYPESIQKLAQFLHQLYTSVKKLASNQHKPFVMAIRNSVSGFSLVAAVVDMTVGIDQRNDFGARFRLVAQKIGAKIKSEGFDTAVVEIRNSDLKRFLLFLRAC